MSSPTEARQAVDRALIATEQRLAAKPPAEEEAKLRLAYSRLWIILGQIDETILTQAAEQVAAATRRLEQVIGSAGTMSLATYLSALNSALVILGVEIPEESVAPPAATPQPPASTPASNPSASSTPNSGVLQEGENFAPAWKVLIDTYRALPEISNELKVATLAQWAVESARGTSNLAIAHNNFGGVKFRERMAGHAKPVDYTGTDGDATVYCHFKSPQEFISGYWHFIASGPYEGWQNYPADGAGYIRHIAPKYAADPSYTAKVLALFDEARRSLQIESLAGSAGGVENLAQSRVAIVVGHNRVSKGATAGSPVNQMEFDFNTIVSNEMKEDAGHYNLNVEVFFREPNGSYSHEIARAYEKVAAFNPVCALELHFNGAASSQANGTEMLCAPNNRAQALSLRMVEPTKNLLGLNLRHGNGVKVLAPGDRGWASVSALPSVPTVLCEPFFGSNANDCLKAGTAGREALGRAYLRGVRDWIESEALNA